MCASLLSAEEKDIRLRFVERVMLPTRRLGDSDHAALFLAEYFPLKIHLSHVLVDLHRQNNMAVWRQRECGAA